MRRSKGKGPPQCRSSLPRAFTHVLRYGSSCHLPSSFPLRAAFRRAGSIRVRSSSMLLGNQPLVHRCLSTMASVIPDQPYLDSSSTSPLPKASKLRAKLERIGKALGIVQMEDWYYITTKDVSRLGGKELFKIHSSMESLLKATYPDYAWSFPAASPTIVKHNQRFKPKSTKRMAWVNIDNQREFMDQLAVKLGIQDPSGWYGVNRKVVIDQGGQQLFVYHSSLKELLKAVYPDYPWRSELFVANAKTRSDSTNKENLIQQLKQIETKMDIKQPEDWYSVHLADLQSYGFPQIKKIQLMELIKEMYPDISWDSIAFLKGRYAQQKRLERTLKGLFKEEEIIFNARKEAGLVNPDTGEYLELDVYFPALKLAFEFQERHHYSTVEYTYQPVEEFKKRDVQKLEVAKAHGLTLIVVPCWWDGRSESLVTTIRENRPELLFGELGDEEGIPKEPPPHFFDKHTPQVEGVGQPTAACFLTGSSIEPTNWWMFEKYDGVRGFWNPMEGAFYSRHGSKFSFPKEIVNAMPPDIFLDGELWFGRDRFQEAMKLVRRKDVHNIAWKDFKYMVFDIPSAEYGTYEQRYDKLVAFFAEHPCKYIEVAKKEICRNTQHMEEFFQDVLDGGGEGIILRDPHSPYKPGRNAGYLKHKKFRDSEAKIVDKVGPSQWECELPNGIRFIASAGTTEFEKRWEPRPGDIVTFKHHGFLLASKKPKLPTLHRLRHDMSWQEVVNNFNMPSPRRYEGPILRKKNSAVERLPKGYWSDRANRQKLFNEFAAAAGFDPLAPENWAGVTTSAIVQSTKKAKGLFRLYPSVIEALSATFPEMNFKTDGRQERRFPKAHWEDRKNCRQFFVDYAKAKGFNPSDTNAWYSIDMDSLTAVEGGKQIRAIHGGFKRALLKSFPELNFAKWIAGK